MRLVAPASQPFQLRQVSRSVSSSTVVDIVLDFSSFASFLAGAELVAELARRHAAHAGPRRRTLHLVVGDTTTIAASAGSLAMRRAITSSAECEPPAKHTSTLVPLSGSQVERGCA